MGWPIQAAGLRDILVTINKLAPELPLYVTENGAAYPDELTADGTVEDDERLDYLRAAHRGVPRTSSPRASR